MAALLTATASWSAPVKRHAVRPSAQACDVALTVIKIAFAKQAKDHQPWVVEDLQPAPPPGPNDIQLEQTIEPGPFADLLARHADRTQKVTACPNVRAYLDASGVPHGPDIGYRLDHGLAASAVIVEPPIVSSDGLRAVAYVDIQLGALAGYGGTMTLRRQGGVWREVDFSITSES